MKTEGLDLSNHLTGWNALCRVWDEHGEHRARWTFMGYGTEVPLDFSKRVFGIDNGAGGKMPTLLDEWKSVGIREASYE